jgi:flagellum-specific peptidoglycan hydrolase FlgJ
MTRNEFIALITPIAVQLRAEGSTIFPSVRIAQSALETGFKINSWNNLVGFKVGTRPPNDYWKGAYVNKGTWEVYDGVRTDVMAHFRAYDTIEDCFMDQELLFRLTRYDRVRASLTPDIQVEMLYACGYATDPEYSKKIMNIIHQYDLTKYDREAELMEELIKEIEGLKKQVQALQERSSMDVPEWAKPAVAAAVEAGLINNPDGGSYDFYRFITIWYRSGIIDEAKNCGE